MIEQMAGVLDAWEPKNGVTTFSTGNDQEQVRTNYFFDSADKVRVFTEPGAVDEDGMLTTPKHEAVNKVGHGLHLVDGPFKSYAQSDKVKALVRELGWVAPVLPQSMYIFKQPRIGGEVTSHQDSTFLYTEPKRTCLGLWLALQDATLQNGCLWARPGSHKESVRRHFARNPEYWEKLDKSAEPMVFKDIGDASKAPWEGKMPTADGNTGTEEAVRGVGFEPLEVKAGDLVVIDGAVDHLSLANTSGTSRHTFQLHLVEGPKEGITWSPENWLQYSDGKPFPDC